ncbi:MAG TPA: efflux RND transporter permease subunit [Chondromyces sp.]|nr:efflux RND transporter permease subunit [Chondromyces sp.]
MKISNFSINRPVFTIVTMILIIILGVVSLSKIPLKLIPDINPPIAVVVTSYEGASPGEIVEKVTKPLEASLATLPGIKTITSTTTEGSNLILLEFSWATHIDEVQTDVLQRIDQTPIPDEADDPQFLKFDPSQFPIIQLSLQSSGGNKELQELAENLEQDLSTVEGVANVDLSGIQEKEIRVELNEENLKKYKLAQSDIVGLIQANNVSMPGDIVESDGKALTTRIISQLTNIEEIKNLVLTVHPLTGDKILLKDVADIQLVDADTGILTRANQQPAVLLSVLQQSDANTAQVSEEFQEKLNELLDKEQYKHIRADILFDQGDYIQMSIGNIGSSLVLGGLFAMLVLFFFLKNVKSPIIIGVAIPYSVIVTFVLMYFADFDLNIMTLGALALGIGMLVDNSIVVIENIYRHLTLGKNSVQAARDGAKEVGAAITASTLTTVAVFLPVAFISGILGQIFKEFALTISFSLFASLIVALTVIPMLASRWLKVPKGDREAVRRRSKVMNRFEGAVRWSLQHRMAVLGMSFLLLVGGALGMTTVGSQFLPPTDEGFFSMEVELENGASLEETNKVVAALEDKLKEENEVDVYVSLVGTTQEDSFRGTGKSNEAEIYVKMRSLDERDRPIFAFVDDIKPIMSEAAKVANPTAEVNFNMQSAAGTSPQTLVFNVRDTNKERLDKAVREIEQTLTEIDYVTELTTNRQDRIPEVQITVDREAALNAGLTPAQVASVVNDATRGAWATQILGENGEVYSVFVQYDQGVTSNTHSLKTLPIKRPDGNYAQLEDLSDIEVKEGPVSIQRIAQQDAVQFTVKYQSDTNLGDISRLVDEKIAGLDLPEETIVTYSGERELLESSINDMVLALVLAIVLIYMVMAAQYESFKYPFVIMFTVPLMVIGVAIALTVTRTPISVPAVIGILILAGIVVNNAIVIVDYIIQRKRSGFNSYEAIIESVKDRARPILMTALTTILGLIPLAIGIGEGTEINQPMAITVIGGLISSTFLTLFVIPVVYSYFDKETRKINGKKIQKHNS